MPSVTASSPGRRIAAGAAEVGAVADRAAPSVEDVQRIVAIENPVIRNLEITECYSELAAAFAARGGEGANWCTFATWASRQAGRSIRGEDMLDDLEQKLGSSRWLLDPGALLWRGLLREGLFQPTSRLGRLTAEFHTPFDALELASACVARGNLKVFEEIGLEFARYLAECPPDAPLDSPEVQQFLDGLRPGDPPDGQGYLRQAFTRYQSLRLEPDPRNRAQLAVLANLEIGYHEQTRLQPEILAALDAASDTEEALGRRVLNALVPSAPRWWPLARESAVVVSSLLAVGAQHSATRLAREVITESFMVLSLPGRVLALGANLPDQYPEPLRAPIDAPLAELLARYEPVPPAVDDCAARDWSVLKERMHYIVHLFCAFHLDADLGHPPYTPEQVAAFRRGEVPDGEL
jgi:hypothetical protein